MKFCKSKDDFAITKHNEFVFDCYVLLILFLEGKLEKAQERMQKCNLMTNRKKGIYLNIINQFC